MHISLTCPTSLLLRYPTKYDLLLNLLSRPLSLFTILSGNGSVDLAGLLTSRLP